MLSRFVRISSIKPSIIYSSINSTRIMRCLINEKKLSSNLIMLMSTSSSTHTTNNNNIIKSSNSHHQSLELTKTSDLVNNDLKNLHVDIRKLFKTDKPDLKSICDYYFDGSGKSIRPLIICAMARALNKHITIKFESKTNDESSSSSSSSLSVSTMKSNYLLDSQRQIALIAEMIHVASLIHDDIIDSSDLRRGKVSVNAQWGCHKAVMAGDYVLAVASRALAQIGNTSVVETLSKVLEDLVQGELMQFGSKESENERFEHYTTKTYRKTASLIANSCKAVAILLIDSKKDVLLNNENNFELIKLSYEFGKNLGIAFQLIDDILDFTSHSDKLGKPGYGADLRLGLATAPVLFAASQYPQLNAMIMRRFANDGDVLKAFELVMKSDGIKESRYLASKYCENAENLLNQLSSSDEINYLKNIIKTIIKREK